MTDKQRLKKAEKRIRELERALRPFAQEACEWLQTVSDKYRPGLSEPRKEVVYSKAVFSIGDLRRAHKLVATA